MKKRILFCGEHPLSSAGNGGMMAAILSQLDASKYEPACFCAGEIDDSILAFNKLPFPIISALDKNDYWGKEKLLKLIQNTSFDILCFLGIDIWRYADIFKPLSELRKAKRFKWVSIFPYDLQNIREDWVNWIKAFDFPYVYSRYGYNKLKKEISNIEYFRPALYEKDLFIPNKNKKEIRKKYFTMLGEHDFIFGFIGRNQFRKEPHKLIKAYFQLKQEIPNIKLYLHTEMQEGVFNLTQNALDCGGKTGDILTKTQGIPYNRKQIVDIYNSIDCYINCSQQEGLSWTVLEAMSCGTPVIASNSTSHIELVKGAGVLVPCKEDSQLPLITERGSSWVETKACRVKDIKKAMKIVYENDALRERKAKQGLERAKKWIKGISNINDVFDKAISTSIIKLVKVKDAFLFAQHSAAGDVLMTTRCLKGLKERHPDLELYYMTQKKYWGILINNPYIDKIIEWKESNFNKFEIVYNPHGKHILKGGFNSLDVKLSDMYPYFCKVIPDNFYIEKVNPGFVGNNLSIFFEKGRDKKYYLNIGENNLLVNKPICVVHTTGGDPQFRTYRNMNIVCEGIKDKCTTIQLGSATDYSAGADLDFRGKLSFRESAWVMSKAKAAVVVDSFLSHLAGALDIPVVVLYGPAPARVVGPVSNSKVVNIEPDKLAVCKDLTNCWGQIRSCKSPCINSLNPITIKKEIQSLLEGEE